MNKYCVSCFLSNEFTFTFLSQIYKYDMICFMARFRFLHKKGNVSAKNTLSDQTRKKAVCMLSKQRSLTQYGMLQLQSKTCK